MDDHYRLMQFIGDNPGSLLSRIGDYYADAEFASDELGRLAEELAVLSRRFNADERLAAILGSLGRLVELAKCEQKPFVALAD